MIKYYVYLLIPITFIFINCGFYDYGVNKNNELLKYQRNYNTNENEYEFTSTLYRYNLDSEFFHIEISHLSNKYGYFESSIIITNARSVKNKKIHFDTIKLNHSYKSKLLVADEIDFYSRKDIDREREEESKVLPSEYIINKGDLSHYVKYSKKYKLRGRPKKLNESIYLEFSINNKKHIIEYEFPIEYKRVATLWEMLKFLSRM